MRLYEHGRYARVQASGQPIDDHLMNQLLQIRGVVIARGQRMPVCYEEIAFVLVLQIDPIAQRTVVIAQV